MKIYDISMSIYPEMPVYKNMDDKKPVITVLKNYTAGNTYESRILLDLHTGTHIDAPLHMLPDGDTVENIDLIKVITKCKVIALTQCHKITAADLENKDIQKGDFILLKTKNSFSGQYNPEFVYLDKSGAEFLKNKEITGVGIDALGIERNQPGHDTHKILFSAGIVILEGLSLKSIEEGQYFLIAAPLKIKGAEAAPARAVLIKGDC